MNRTGCDSVASDSWLIRVAGGDEPDIDRLAGLGRSFRCGMGRAGSESETRRDFGLPRIRG